MNTAELKKKLPTFVGYWEKRRAAARNRLPKHLRPPSVWPLWVQLALNAGLIITLTTLMLNRDEYVTEAGPAITMVVTLLLLIYTVISGFRLKIRYQGIGGQRLAKMNFWLMVIAFLCWPASVAVFLP